jgi:transcriptional regulator with XRE-family HTH domain
MTGHVKELCSSGPFSSRLRCLMNEQHISSDQLAGKTGISERLIRKYRSGRTEPRDWWGEPTENGHKLADALGVPVDELLPPEGPVAA